MSFESQRNGGSRAWVAIAILFVLYTLSFLDRGILNLLVGPVKSALKIGDVEMSVLLGAAFSLFYGLVGLPLARIADVANRRDLVVVGVFLWAACTILCGFANSFWMLFALRVGLALGEGALSPAAYSMISDWFTPRQRSLPTTVYSWAGGIGTSLGSIVLGFAVAFIVEKHGLASFPVLRRFQPWQLMFFVVGFPTLLVGLAFMLLVREPPRVFTTKERTEPPSWRDILRFISVNRALCTGLLLGCGLNNLGYVAIRSWAPQIIHRSFGWKISDASIALGVLSAVTSVVGYIIVPRVSDIVRDRMGRPDVPILIAMALSVVGGGLLALAPISSSAIWFLVLEAAGTPLIVASSILSVTSIAIVSPPRMRAVLTVLYLIMASAVTTTIAPTVAALLSTHVFAHDGGRALGMGVSVVAGLTPVVAVALLAVSRRAYAAAITTHLLEAPS